MRIRYTIEGSNVGMRPYTDEFDIDDEDFDGLSEDERDKDISMYVESEVCNHVNWGWEIVE